MPGLGQGFEMPTEGGHGVVEETAAQSTRTRNLGLLPLSVP
jgi:hypothetical protein